MRFAGCLFLFAAMGFGQKITFNKDVAPVIYSHCAPCHHTGGAGPFPLITYKDVRQHASQIVDVTGRRYMPPWPPEKTAFEFAGDRSLSAEQIATISNWLKDGKLEGDAGDLPPAPQFSSDWQMGRPDLVLRMAAPFKMPGSGTDVFRNFVVPTGLAETKYVRGLELRLSNPRVVHHANVVLDHNGELKRRDGEDGQPGFPGMDVMTEAAADQFDPDSHFLFWKPASALRLQPEAMSWKLDANTDLVVNLHLQPTGREESVQAEIGLYFSSTPPTLFPMLIQMEHDGAIHIAPGDRESSVTDSLVLPVDVDLLAIYPHAHYLGKTIEAWAILPNGTRQTLIRIGDWDINWQAEYEYKKPPFLPKGTKVAMRVTYDNSSGNPRNPSSPPKLVVTGNRSEDEMGHVWLQVLPRQAPAGNSARMAIEASVMERRLQKYPGDFVAHYNLGALDQVKGNLSKAEAEYEAALKLDGRNVTALNSLATVLMSQDKLDNAIRHLRTALSIDPQYQNARYNLARTLAAQGDLDAALPEYERFAAARPDDAGAQAALGTIFYRKCDLPRALIHFESAARLDPKDADVQTNLGTLLAIGGDLRGAEKAFRQALTDNPQHEAARANLARVQAQLSAQP